MAALEKEGEAATMIQQPADGGVELEPEEEGERAVRERRDGETRAELKKLRKLRKVRQPLPLDTASRQLVSAAAGYRIQTACFCCPRCSLLFRLEEL